MYSSCTAEQGSNSKFYIELAQMIIDILISSWDSGRFNLFALRWPAKVVQVLTVHFQIIWRRLKSLLSNTRSLSSLQFGGLKGNLNLGWLADPGTYSSKIDDELEATRSCWCTTARSAGHILLVPGCCTTELSIMNHSKTREKITRTSSSCPRGLSSVYLEPRLI